VADELELESLGEGLLGEQLVLVRARNTPSAPRLRPV